MASSISFQSLSCRLLYLPASDDKPQRKQQLHKGHWKEESKTCVRVQIRLQRGYHPPQPSITSRMPIILGM